MGLLSPDLVISYSCQQFVSECVCWGKKWSEGVDKGTEATSLT